MQDRKETMRILLATDVLLAYLVKDDFIGGLDILFQWMKQINACRCIDFTSIVVLTNFVSPQAFAELNDFTFINKLPPKTTLIKEYERITTEKTDKNLLPQLNLLASNRVDYIISENSQLHTIAQILNLDDRLYTIEGFLEKCSVEYRDKDLTKGLIVKEELMGHLSIKDPFFQSFIDEYAPYYYEWFQKKAQDKVYISQSPTGDLYALLKLKLEDSSENYKDIEPEFTPAKRLKISSFKVSYTGSKLAERFMRIIFDQALFYHVDEIYITIYNSSTSRRRLMDLVGKWGFEFHGFKNKKEWVFVRNFRKHLRNNVQKDFPYHTFQNSAFIIPIYREYAKELLPTTEMSENKDDYEPYKCAIRKVLVLHTDHPSLDEGAIFLFYQKTGNKDERGIIAVGVVERVYRNFENERAFISRCRKRSVLDNERLKNCWNEARQQAVAVDFLYCYSFNQHIIPESTLTNNQVDTSSLHSQHLIEISEFQYKNIISGTDYEKSIVVDKASIRGTDTAGKQTF